jgi:hypothetical protein
MYQVEQKMYMYMQSSSIVKSASLHRRQQCTAPHGAHSPPEALQLSRTSEALARPSRLSKHDDLITPNTVAVASEACAPVAETNINISYRAPLRLLLRDE